jgi:NADPH-dependent curcumin reductase CurA
VIFKDCVPCVLQVSDMHLTAGTIKLKVSEDCADGVLVKNLYFSNCDPYMRKPGEKLSSLPLSLVR